MWRWALVSPDGVAPSRMVDVPASVNVPLHHKVQKFSSGTGCPGWSRKKDCKMVVCVCVFLIHNHHTAIIQVHVSWHPEFIKTGSRILLQQRCTAHIEGSVHKGSILRNPNFSGNEFL